MDVDSEDIVVSIAPCQDVGPDGAADVKVAISVQAPERVNRTPTDVCCVVDISGSMRSAATYEADGVVKSDGLAILDIVKHAVKAVMHMLQETDRLALVAFDDVAELVFELTDMSDGGRAAAIRALETLEPRGKTNIWSGVQCGMEALRGKAGGDDARQQALLLLTDGQPNISPPRGHVEELQDYMERFPDFNFQLNSFGFGYDLNSEILVDLAVAGNGTYAFIPDAVIVGTVFVNSMANVLSTRTQAASLHLTCQGDAAFSGPVGGDLKVTETTPGSSRIVHLGPLQVGQLRDVIVTMRLPPGDGPYLEVFVSCAGVGDTAIRRVGSGQGVDRVASETAAVGAMRSEIVSVGFQAVQDGCANKGATAAGAVKKLAAMLASSEGGHLGSNDAFVGMRSDVEGRMSKALKGKERFNRWGKHYLRALMRSHQLQLCTNFMDGGLQCYGGALYQDLRAQGDQIFLSLPLPRSSGHATSSVAMRTSVPSSAAAPNYVAAAPDVASMVSPASASAAAPEAKTYYAGAGGGCFGSTSTVLVVERDSSSVRFRRRCVSDVCAGEEVVVVGGGVARIRCVVVIARPSSRGLVALPGGLTITGGHPVKLGGIWQRPRCVVGGRRVQHNGCVYNFILEERTRPLLVDGIECAVWGHDLIGEVIAHPYFGSSLVIDDVKALLGWEKGLVRLTDDSDQNHEHDHTLGISTGVMVC